MDLKDTPIGARIIYNDGEIGTLVYVTTGCLCVTMDKPGTGSQSPLNFGHIPEIVNWRSARFDGESNCHGWGVAKVGVYEECPY
jgi:hypothetical protein